MARETLSDRRGAYAISRERVREERILWLRSSGAALCSIADSEEVFEPSRYSVSQVLSWLQRILEEERAG